MTSTNYETRYRNYSVYVTREERIHSTANWALYASAYKDEIEARESAIRAVNDGYRHAELRIHQLFSTVAKG